MAEAKAVAIPKQYKPWIILSVVVLVGSLLLLAVAVTGGMINLRAETPLWVVVVGGAAVLGILLGFAGFFGLMALAGWQTWREGRKVQVIRPERTDR